MMNQYNEIPSEPEAKLRMLNNLVALFMPLEKYGFKESVQFLSDYRPDVPFPSGKGAFSTLIYSSERCRVKFLLDRERYEEILHIYYGRIHAPNDQKLVKWNDEDCYCWHNFELALKFLDGASPTEAVNRRRASPLGIQDYLKLGLERTFQPEWVMPMHAFIWEFYGYRLFDLFDLRRSSLWIQFTQFVKEYYDLLGRSPSVKPSLDKIC